MLAHQPSHPLAVHELALVAQLGGDPTIAVGLELCADRLDAGDDLGITIGSRRAVVGRSSDAHQPASLSDGETTGPAITDVGALLGRRPCCRAPFKNSISSVEAATLLADYEAKIVALERMVARQARSCPGLTPCT